MDYSPDGQLLVSLGDSHGNTAVVKVWRLSDRILLRTFDVSAGVSNPSGLEVKFLPDNQAIIVTGVESGSSYIKRVRVSDNHSA